jgi:hypothetical protein
MFIALIDYLAYRRRSGRYSRERSQSAMAFGFDRELPPKAIAALRPGDAIFLQTFDSWLSWAVMYMTKSEISHAAIYLGNGLIFHATLSGVVQESIESLYGARSRLLPCTIEASDEQRAKLRVYIASQLGRPYGWGIVFAKALRILFGRLWPLFRWTFVLDIAVLAITADLLFLLFTRRFIGVSIAIPLYLFAIFCGWLSWRRHGYRQEDITPDMVLYILHQMGGSLVMDAYEMSELITKTRTESAEGKFPTN